ncbi:hypothetical protein ACSQ67_004031 [Phaseolus vulgaris]
MQEERQRLVVVPRGMVRVEEWFGVSTKSKREHNNSLSLSCHVRDYLAGDWVSGLQIFVGSMSRVVTWIFCCFLTPLVPPRDLRVFVILTEAINFALTGLVALASGRLEITFLSAAIMLFTSTTRVSVLPKACLKI